jgi:hypothetical protein
MRKPQSVETLENLGRVRLSKNFFMRDFLYSEVANLHGLPNIPENPDLVIETGKHLCEDLLEPLQEKFGRISIRSAYRSPSVNQFCNENKFSCAKNATNAARHIWDLRDADGQLGAMACIVVHWYIDRFEQSGDFRPMAWWMHDHLPYSELFFFPKLCAFNIGWHEIPKGSIESYIHPKGYLTRPGMANHTGDHSDWYTDFPK